MAETDSPTATLPDYLRSEYIGGIPSSVLAQPGNGTITTASGKEMYYDVQPQSFRLSAYTEGGKEVEFSAGVDMEEMPSGAKEPCITLDVFTKLSDGSYHPDFRAEPLFHAAVSYLNRDQPVPHIMGKWNEEGDNTAQFKTNLSRFGANPTP